MFEDPILNELFAQLQDVGVFQVRFPDLAFGQWIADSLDTEPWPWACQVTSEAGDGDKGAGLLAGVATAPSNTGLPVTAAKAIYRQRGAVAEFPNAWIKDKLGLKQFRLRGLIKARLEVLWTALTYNIQK